MAILDIAHANFGVLGFVVVVLVAFSSQCKRMTVVAVVQPVCI